jgi:hypothetical protein
VPTFEVTESRGWYEAQCRELGVTITARHLEQIEATARRTAARTHKGVPVSLVKRKQEHKSVFAKIAGFLLRIGL